MKGFWDAIGWCVRIAAVIGALWFIGSCEENNEQRTEGCRIRWHHATVYAESLATAERCGRSGNGAL